MLRDREGNFHRPSTDWRPHLGKQYPRGWTRNRTPEEMLGIESMVTRRINHPRGACNTNRNAFITTARDHLTRSLRKFHKPERFQPKSVEGVPRDRRS